MTKLTNPKTQSSQVRCVAQFVIPVDELLPEKLYAALLTLCCGLLREHCEKVVISVIITLNCMT